MRAVHLFRLAAELCREPASEAALRRAASTTYYALFNHLCALCADALVGEGARGGDEWLTVYRSLTHEQCRTLQHRLGDELKSVRGIKQLVATLGPLQTRRHEADYDPRPFALGRVDILSTLRESVIVARDLGGLNPELRLALAVRFLFKTRRTSEGGV